jgi:hypothetical protein
MTLDWCILQNHYYLWAIIFVDISIYEFKFQQNFILSAVRLFCITLLNNDYLYFIHWKNKQSMNLSTHQNVLNVTKS